MMDLFVVAAVLLIAIAVMPSALEGLWEDLPWLPLALVVLVGMFLLRAILQTVARAVVKARRRGERVARRRWLAGMARLSREELFRLQAAWAVIERSEAMDPSDPGYEALQETRRQAEEFVQKMSALAASQGKLLPESSAACHKVLWVWEREGPGARAFWDPVGRPAAEPGWRSRARSLAWVVGGLYQRLRAGVPRPQLVVAGVSVLLGAVLIAGGRWGVSWGGVGLLLAGGCIGAALARRRRPRRLER